MQALTRHEAVLTRQVIRLEYRIDGMYEVLRDCSAAVCDVAIVTYSEDNICLIKRASQQVHHIVAVVWERPREQLRQEDPQSLYPNQSGPYAIMKSSYAYVDNIAETRVVGLRRLESFDGIEEKLSDVVLQHV